jgi:hypothetical protein
MPLSVKDYGPIAVEQYPVLRVPGHRPGQDLCLDVTAGLGQALRGERVVDPDHVLLDEGTVIASVSASGPSFRIPATRIPALAAAVIRAADEVSRRLGWAAR